MPLARRPAATPSPRSAAVSLRGYTQHNLRNGGSVLRGPHVPPRKDAPEGITSEPHRGEAGNGFGNGL